MKDVTPIGYIDIAMSGPGHVWLDDDLWMLSPTIYRDTSSDYEVRVSIDRAGGGVGPVEVLFTATEGEQIDSTALRELKFRDMAEQAAFNAVHWSNDKGRRTLNPIALVLHQLRAFATPSPSGRYSLPDEKGLEALSAVYRMCRLVGANPQRTLMDNLELPRSTANYWIAAVR